MFSKDDYLVFDGETNERLHISSIHMGTDEEENRVSLFVYNENTPRQMRNQEDLVVLKKVDELCNEEHQLFNVYEWDVVCHNQTGNYYTFMSKDMVLTTDKDFHVRDILEDDQLDIFNTDTFTRLGNTSDLKFIEYIAETIQLNKVDKWRETVSVGNVIHSTNTNGVSFRHKLVSVEEKLGKKKFHLVNMDTGCIIPAFVGKCESDAIDYLIEIKYDISKI
jgi:hypothetical protein